NNLFVHITDRCYLEHAGSSLYPQCLLGSINEDLMKNLYMNPHSDKYTRDCIEQIRWLVLNHFNTDSASYSVIFTSGTTQSLKLIAESFEFSGNEDDDNTSNSGSFVYLRDNHTSVLGLREIAINKHADIIHISHEDFLTSLNQEYVTKGQDRYKNDSNALLAYPAQNNFNGFKYPIDCINNIKNGCLNSYLRKQLCETDCNWYILLDAAALVSTSKLDLCKVQPDFLCFSFYKIFGFPTGLGALLVKNGSENVLSQKKHFGGGTVDIVLSSEDFHVKKKTIYERFEDGTVPFLSIIALKHCFDTMHKLIPKVVHNDLMETISQHTYFLAKDLYNQLSEMRHENGIKAAVLYMDSDFNDIKKQGAIVTFNLLREDGSYIGYAEVTCIRTGCFCNSGSCQRHLKASNRELKDMYKAGHKCGDEFDLINGKPTGAVRVSFGYYNTFRDVDAFILMIYRCFVNTKVKRPRRSLVNFKKFPLEMKVPNGADHKMLTGQELIINDSHHSSLDSRIELKEIAIFPVKSCGAFKIKSGWMIGPKGFEFDREWMIVNDNRVCLTQKQNTRMCRSPISIPLKQTSLSTSKTSSLCQSKICADSVKGHDCGDAVADWISEALEVSFLRLIRQASTGGRSRKKNDEVKQKMLSLSNQAQYLLINKATVRWLCGKIRDPLFTDAIDDLVDRFRANLIIDMETELAERDWNKVVIGKHEFK
ncbi:Molybdenum cofactor sulfurase, partial [Operophtera brumata]